MHHNFKSGNCTLRKNTGIWRQEPYQHHNLGLPIVEAEMWICTQHSRDSADLGYAKKHTYSLRSTHTLHCSQKKKKGPCKPQAVVVWGREREREKVPQSWQPLLLK